MRRGICALLAVAVVGAGCGGDDDSEEGSDSIAESSVASAAPSDSSEAPASSSDATSGSTGAPTPESTSGSTETPASTSGSAPAASSDDGEAEDGGTLRFAAYAEILGLDPIVAIGFGTSGGNQQGAIYDTIVRYDAETQTYENRTAESVTSNDDFTEWTVELKPGITFTDGTPYDAEAVRFGMNRHRSGTPGAPSCEELYACPASNAASVAYMKLVTDIEVVDDLTVKFTLSEPWPAFQVALSLEAAMIPSPTAIKEQCDPAAPAKDCAFNTMPVGAGPFMVDAPMAAGEPLRLVRNPDYWDGPVHLDALEFVTASDAGGAQTLELFNSGAVNVAYLQDPTAIAQAKDAGVDGLSTLTQGGQALLFNIGATLVCTAGEPAPSCTGKPDGPVDVKPITSDPRLRQAIAAAIDPQIIDQRATGGVGHPTNALFVDPFEWNPGLPGPELDLDRAEQLVEEVKADGWDGTLKFLTPTTPFASNVGLAVQAQLAGIGIDVVLDARQGQGWQSAVTSSKDFEMTMWGLATTQDDSGIWQLKNALETGSIGNRGAYSSPAMDAALKEAVAAETDEDKVAAYAKIQEDFNEGVPYVVYSVREEYRAYAPEVHGLISSHRYIVFFDDAWIES